MICVRNKYEAYFYMNVADKLVELFCSSAQGSSNMEPIQFNYSASLLVYVQVLVLSHSVDLCYDSVAT